MSDVVPVDYLAKDYAGLRQALTEFVPTRLPAWTEQSEADLGVALLELVAATGDSLSYVQDRIANEAFLGSARERRSVQAHLALVDYALGEGSSAETWLFVQVDRRLALPAGFRVSAPPGPGAAPIAFETSAPARLDPSQNGLQLAAGEHVPQGATSALLAGAVAALAAGDRLLFSRAGATPELVRLVEAPEARPDGTTLVTWAADDALRGEYAADATLVRGNLVHATHGVTVREELRLPGRPQPETSEGTVVVPPAGASTRTFLISAPGFDPDGEQVDVALRTPAGRAGPTTTFTATQGAVADEKLPLPGDAEAGTWSATLTGRTSGRTAVGAWQVESDSPEPVVPRPRLRLALGHAPLSVVDAIPQIAVAVDGRPWRQLPSLIRSSPAAEVYRVELADGGFPTVVFGQGGAGGGFGRRPPDGSRVSIAYRIGLGTAGNVGAGLLTVPADAVPGLETVTNPLPATGGADPEPVDRAKEAAAAPAGRREVAVSAADYATVALELTDAAGTPLLADAGAALRWTGSWLTATLTVEPSGADEPSAQLTGELAARFASSRLAGYDLRVVPPIYLPIDLTLRVTVTPGFDPADVGAALRVALLPGGGFFDRANFGFGDPVAVSALFAAVTAVPGVAAATILRLARSGAPDPDADTATALASGFLTVGSDQIVQLENDPGAPGRGVLTLVVEAAGT